MDAGTDLAISRWWSLYRMHRIVGSLESCRMTGLAGSSKVSLPRKHHWIGQLVSDYVHYPLQHYKRCAHLNSCAVHLVVSLWLISRDNTTR
jgi:hypothetical protein